MEDDWWDDYQLGKDADFAENPKRLENYMSKEEADKERREDAEAARIPPDSFIENGQWVKIITEETHATIKEFFRRMDSIGAIHRLTIMEDRRCALVYYSNGIKDDIIILKCIAIAGTEDDTWYGIDYFGDEHVVKRELMFP